MNEKKSSKSGGITFLGALALLFIGLKLGGVIHWSWWYVTLPLWGEFALILSIALIRFFMLVVGKTIEKVWKRVEAIRLTKEREQ